MLIDLVRSVASTDPHRPVLVSHERLVTYEQLLRRSEATARGLVARSIERVACVVKDAADVIALMVGSSAVGTELCIYSSALSPNEIDDLAATFDHTHLIADRPIVGVRPEVTQISDLLADDGPLPTPPTTSLALILTTGTTGRPKGARHDWGRLAAGVRRRDDTARERWLLAYNLNQFAGIQVILHVLVGGSTLVVPESNQPRDAVAAMRDLAVTHASGTPTFWRFVTTLVEATADEMPLEQITLGGEAIPSMLLPELARSFPSARVSQIYASTEFGSSVSVRDGRHGLPLTVLDRGSDAEVQFRVVDGELHARSRVGMLGYAGESDDDGWRPTGDLVEIQGDRILFIGRSSDVINVGGVKVHPLMVEEAVAKVDGIEFARVYGRSNPMTGQIVAIDVVPRAGVDQDGLADDIRAACAELPEAARPRRIKFVEALRMRENKIVRKPTSDMETNQ